MKLAFLLLGGAAAVLTYSADALACGATAEPYYVPSEQAPNGGAVPLNAPLVVELSESANGPAESHLNPLLTLTIEGSDAAVELTSVGSAPHLVWVPQQSLVPNTTYEAHFNTGYEGHPDTIWQFTTGPQRQAPLAVEGKLEVSLELAMEPTIVCPPGRCGCNEGDCLAACRNGSPNPVTRARVKVPRVKGGFNPRTGFVRLTDGTAYDFTEPSKSAGHVNEGYLVFLGDSVTFDDAGNPLADVLITMPEESAPYRPCFALRVTDERGDIALADSLCLEETFPRSNAPADPSDDEAGVGRGSDSSSACGFGVAEPRPFGAALALLGLVALTRRRRSKTAL